MKDFKESLSVLGLLEKLADNRTKSLDPDRLIVLSEVLLKELIEELHNKSAADIEFNQYKTEFVLYLNLMDYKILYRTGYNNSIIEYETYEYSKEKCKKELDYAIIDLLKDIKKRYGY